MRWYKDIDQPGPFTKAQVCAIHPGSKDSSGLEHPQPSWIYVGDTLMATIGRKNIERIQEATIEAIFVIMGNEYCTHSAEICAVG